MGPDQGQLFHMAPLEAPKAARKPGTKAWGGRAVMELRKLLGATLPAPCWRCGRMLTESDKWHVGHILDRADGGVQDPRMATLADVAVECEKCNTSEGGKRGAAVVNARRTNNTSSGPAGTFRERTIKWY